MIAALLYNINRDPKKTRPVRPEDFFPNLRKHSQKDEPDWPGLFAFLERQIRKQKRREKKGRWQPVER